MAFGLGISSNVELPLLPCAAPGGDLDIRMGGVPPSFARLVDDSPEPWAPEAPAADERIGSYRRLRDSGALAIDFPDGVTFVIAADGTSIWARWPLRHSLAYASDYILAPILGLALRLRGVLALHGSAVRIGDGAVALVGPSGAGKSTLSAALVDRGHALFGDDVVAIQFLHRGVRVLPGVPVIRLWPDSQDASLRARELPALPERWDKSRLSALGVMADSCPLMALVLLDAREAGEPLLMSDVSPAQALATLSRESFGARIVDRRMRAEEFRSLQLLIDQVPVWRLRAPDDLARLPELCALIERGADSMRGADLT
ncbi:MAG: HPr kinase [Gemmatimonadetes bacterium]|nr:HPr kinase [Gemmatimonadota bacterium]